MIGPEVSGEPDLPPKPGAPEEQSLSRIRPEPNILNDCVILFISMMNIHFT